MTAKIPGPAHYKNAHRELLGNRFCRPILYQDWGAAIPPRRAMPPAETMAIEQPFIRRGFLR